MDDILGVFSCRFLRGLSSPFSFASGVVFGTTIKPASFVSHVVNVFFTMYSWHILFSKLVIPYSLLVIVKGSLLRSPIPN